MYSIVKLENWERKEIYLYFKSFENPFYNICIDIDVTMFYANRKEIKNSIGSILHYCALSAANQVQEFRMRDFNEEIVVFDKVNAGATLLLDDRTIRYCLYEYDDDYDVFVRNMKVNEDFVKVKGVSDSRTNEIDVVHFSIIPWLSFSSISQARKTYKSDSVPKITFGKIFSRNNNWYIPTSIEVNHCFVDALHINNLIEIFQNQLDKFINDQLNG